MDPIVSGVPQCVLGPLLFILYISEMFLLVENRIYAYIYVDNSTLLAVVRKPADRLLLTDCCCQGLLLPGRQTVAASLNNRDLARILEWCNHWCIILNPNKTKVFVVSRSKTLILPYGDLVLSGVSICANPNLDILGVKFDSMLTFEKTMSVVLFPVLSEN